MAQLLSRSWFQIGKARVQRLMREHAIRACRKRFLGVTTDSRHKVPVVPALLAHQVTPEVPNESGVPIRPTRASDAVREKRRQR